jgi:plastocyanin
MSARGCASGFSHLLIVCALGLLGACGGSSSVGSSSTPTTPSTPAGTATVTVTTGGVSPQSLTVARGTRITFVNNDSRTHDMESDPHPAHTDCPELNQVGILVPGQSRQSGALTVPRSCGYHDHEQPDVRSLQGTITIQP